MKKINIPKYVTLDSLSQRTRALMLSNCFHWQMVSEQKVENKSVTLIEWFIDFIIM